MLFLNYKENDMKYIYNSSIKNIIIKQNYFINSFYLIKLPKIKYYFIYKKIIDLNNTKIYNNILLLWLLTGKKMKIKKINYKLNRGIKYYRFILSCTILNENLILNNFDFFLNKFFFLLDNLDLKNLKNKNYLFLKFKNLEYFSNLKLSSSFYTTRINNIFNICFYFKKYNELLNLLYFLKQFKFIFKNK